MKKQRNLKRSCGNLLQQVRSSLPLRASLTGGDPLIALDQRPSRPPGFFAEVSRWEVTDITGAVVLNKRGIFLSSKKGIALSVQVEIVRGVHAISGHTHWQ